MSTSWEEASACPSDGSPGKVEHRKPAAGGGQVVTLTCNQTRCPYNVDGWVVSIRPDNTIPDKIDPRTREREYAPLFAAKERRSMILENLQEQMLREQQPGAEVSN